MRKHNPRRWLHAILDLLPVILIPVFMIYSHRHTLTEGTEVDIQYKYQSNEVNNINDVIPNNIYTFEDYNFIFDVNDLRDSQVSFVMYFYNEGVTLTGLEDTAFHYGYEGSTDSLELYVVEGDVTLYCGTPVYFLGADLDDFSISVSSGTVFSFPTLQDYFGFNDYLNFYEGSITLPNYTDFNVIESVEVQDTNYNIMSVFTNDLSNTVDNYFNMNQVFNLNDVWSWINTNIFSGTAPLIAKTIWNIIVYEFVVDLLFVFYGFFMFLIDFIDNLLDKPFNKGR